MNEVRSHPGHIILVIEEIKRGKIIATGTGVMERKFIRDGSYVCHIEDIVVERNTRNEGLGKMLIKNLIFLKFIFSMTEALMEIA